MVATAAVGTLAMASSEFPRRTDGKGLAPNLKLQTQFKEAAQEFDVPQSVLMAVSYRQTRWESHGGLPSTTGAYNVMGLTRVMPADVEDGEETGEHRLTHLNMSGDPAVEKHFNPQRALTSLSDEHVDTGDPRLHSLDKAAELVHEPAKLLQSDAGQSIRAGAALLARYQREATGDLPDDPGRWYPAVARFSQAPDRTGADLFAKKH
ncbi:hypothetical protein OG985_45960 [Streptomyces sp. NBC_00289]|uniref:hypothetical protein n=1 Tax=Streptomyces sp. NBC_00289 TaxID=2975703 RepID=UPI00324C9FB3